MSDSERGHIRVSEAVGWEAISARLAWIGGEHERTVEDLYANQREFDLLAEKERDLLAEQDRLRRKLSSSLSRRPGTAEAAGT